MDHRKPAVVGQFYPSDPEKLKEALASYINPSAKKIKALGIVVPHAGYMYSGGVAGKVYAQIQLPQTIIILSPNHTGLGAEMAMMNRGTWQLPFGDVPINEELANKLLQACDALEVDSLAHAREHSLEVQIPFLQYLKKDFSFVPLTIGHVPFEQCQEVGKAIAQVIQNAEEPILLVASTDMNHYESQKITLEKDEWAITAILDRDAKKLYEVVHQKNISMCGIIPTTIMLTACNLLGASRATLVDHKTSGDVSGDYDAVVGYAGFIIT